MPLYNQNQNRHGRMFELLRQSQLAESTQRRVNADARKHAKTAVALQLQQRAVQSLQGATAPQSELRSAFYR